MVKKLNIAWLTLSILMPAMVAFAQTDTSAVRHADSTAAPQDTVPARLRVAVLAPLYLDSAFDASGNYRYEKQLPRYFHQGLEFWEGAQLAIDSLKEEGIEVDIHVYDTRSGNNFESLLTSGELRRMNLLIGHVNVNEAAQLARVAALYEIPFINANLPNDANVANNPNYVILNSTLTTHCAGIYKFLQRNFALSNIIVLRKKGAQEDRLRQYFTEIEKNTSSVPLKLKYVTLPDNYTTADLTPHLDSNITNVVLVGSLDPVFAQALCQKLAGLSTSYATTVFGMPTWEAIDFQKSFYKGIEIYYPTPFYVNPTNKVAVALTPIFKNEYFVSPSETVYLGYETLYHFTHLLALHRENLGSSLGDKKFTVFSEFDIQPVINRTTQALDYFENKKLYMIRKVDGAVKGVY